MWLLHWRAKKLEKTGFNTDLDWKSSRIHSQTKKVDGMAGREKNGVKVFFKDVYIVMWRILRK